MALNNDLAGIVPRPDRDRGFRTTAIKQRPFGPKTLILALMPFGAEGIGLRAEGNTFSSVT